MTDQERPSFDDILDDPTGQQLQQCTTRLRAIAQRLHDIAWSLTVREIGRTLSEFARHLDDDAGRLEVLSMMVPAMESLPDDKKEEIKKRYEEHDARKRRRRPRTPP
jgi:hypothetical protein